MRRFPRPSTLQLSFPAGQTLALAVLILLLIAIAAESIVRLPAVESHLPAPSIGSNHAQFEIELHQLEEFARDGPVDCVFIGSSMVYRGISPEVVSAAYTQRTGTPLRCFSFGITGLVASDLAILAEYIIETYHPQLLIYGISPRDISKLSVKGNEDVTARQIAALDWIQYRQGALNVPGWFFEHARAFRYAFLYRTWMFPNFSRRMENRRRLEADILAGQGYVPLFATMIWPVSQGEKSRARRLMYNPAPQELESVQRIIALHHPPQTQVMLVEVPFYEGVVTELIGQDTYVSFNQQIEACTESAGVIYWPTTLLHLIPADGWYNLNHLNKTGAEAFSRWLGDQLGQAAMQGKLVLH